MFRVIASFTVLTIIYATCVRSQCTPAPDSRTTYWGHQNAVTSYSQPLKTLRGMVVLGFATPEIPKDGVLVEVFDHPELAIEGNPSRTGQKRLKACLTEKDGSFSFDLPPGKYELRCSKPVDWNCSSVIVEIARKGVSKKLTLRLGLAE
jgi:hypothetical protein